MTARKWDCRNYLSKSISLAVLSSQLSPCWAVEIPTLPAGSTPHVIEGENLSAAQINQTLKSGPRTFTIETNTPVTGNIVIPRGVTLVNIVDADSSALSIKGNLTGYGHLYFSAADSLPVSSATLNANNIVISTGSMIASLANLGLNINVLANLINHGAIISGGSLNITAGNSIMNTGLIQSAGNLNMAAASSILNALPQGTTSGIAATIQAMQNVNLSAQNIFNQGTILSDKGNILAATASLTNSANITSQLGNIAITSLLGTNNSVLANIQIDGNGGTFSAVNGAIQIGDPNGPFGNIAAGGGDYHSKSLDMYAGDNAIDLNVGQISGTINSTAGIEHIHASTPQLTLGNNCINGDPTYVNTAVGGSIVITGVNTFTENVAILANGDITMDPGAQIKANGVNVTVVAGAKTTTSGNTAKAIPAGAKASQNTTILFDPAVSNGGSIDFSKGLNPAIDTSSPATSPTVASKPAGSVVLAALSSNGSGGNIFLGTNDIDASNYGLAINSGSAVGGGNVTIIAGGTPSTKQDTITVGNIKTGAGSVVTFVQGRGVEYNPGQSGSVTILTEQPTSTTANKPVVIDVAGNFVGAERIKGNGLTISTAGVKIAGDINTAGSGGFTNEDAPSKGVSAGSITIKAGGDISTGNLYAFGAGGAGGIGFVDGGAGGNGAAISVSTENGAVTINGSVSSSGGGGGGGAGHNQALNKGKSDGGAGGNGAPISIIAKSGAKNAAMSITGGVYAVDGARGGDGGDNLEIDTEGGGGGGGGSFGGGGGGGAATKKGGGGGAGIFGGGGGGKEGDDPITNFTIGGGDGGSGNGGGRGTGGGGNGGSPGGGGGFLGGGGGPILGAGGGGATGGQGANGKNGGSVSASKYDLTVSSNSALTVGGQVVGGNVTIRAGAAENLSLGDSVTAFQKATIESANGDISLAAGKTLNAPQISITSAQGAIGSKATPIGLGTTNLTVVTGTSGGTKDIYLSGPGNITLEKASTNGIFSVNAKGGVASKESTFITAKSVDIFANDINVGVDTPSLSTTTGLGTIIRAKGSVAIDLAQAPGNRNYSLTSPATVTLNSNVTGSIISISAGAIVLGNPAVVLKAPNTVSLKSTGLGDIGSSGTPLQTETQNLEILGTGNVYVNNLGAVNLRTSTAGPGPLPGSPITFSLSTTPGTGGFQLDAGYINITGNVTVTTRGTTSNPINGSIILNSSEGKGAALNKGGIRVESSTPGILKADTVLLTDGAAGAGTSPIGNDYGPIVIDANVVSANTQASVYIKNLDKGNLNVLDSTVPNANIFALVSFGSIDNKPGFGTITGGTIILVAGQAGSLGISAAQPALTNSNNITLKAGSSVFARNLNSNPVSIAIGNIYGSKIDNSAAVNFSVEAPNTTSLTNQQPLSSGTVSLKAASLTNLFPLTGTKAINLEATGAGNLSINQSIKAPEITLAAGSGTIVQLAEGTINATKALTITLGANGAVANLQTAKNDAKELNTNVTGDGQVLFRQVDPMTINKIEGADQTLSILYTGSLKSLQGSKPFTVKQLTFAPTNDVAKNSIDTFAHFVVTGPTVLSASGGGDIAIGGIIGSSDVTLTTSGKTGDIFIKGGLSGNQVTLGTGGGNIIQTRAAAPVNANGPLILNLNNGGSADLSKVAGSIPVLRTNVQGPGKVSVISSKSIVLDSIVGVGQNLTVVSADAIVTPNPIEATSLSLTSNGAGGIANPGNPVTTIATTVALNATATGGNAFFSGTNTAGVTLQASSANQILDAKSAGPITVAGAITGNQITLTSGGNGGIAVNGKIGTANSVSVTLTAPGTGSITSKTAAELVSAQTITMTSSGGSIAGAAANTAMKVAGNVLAFNTSGSGVVNIDNTVASGAVTLNNSTSGLAFSFASPGPLTINNVSSNAPASASTGNVTLTGKTAALNISPGAIITANGGNIRLQNNDIKGGSIFIGANSQIKGSSTVPNVGEVVINLGVKVDKSTGQQPANVVANITGDANIYYGKNGITTLPPDNTLNAEGRNIIFDTDASAAGSITLGGGVTITADPPPGMSTVSVSSMAASSAAPRAAVMHTGSAGSGVNPGQAFAAVQSEPKGADFLSSVQNYISGAANAIQAQSNMLQGGISRTDTIDSSWKNLDASAKFNAQQVLPPRNLSLPHGDGVFAPKSHTTIDTPLGKVSIKAGSIVFVSSSESHLSVHNLDDLHRDAVSIQTGNRTFHLSPGKHLAIAIKSLSKFEQINPVQSIGYRRMTNNEIEGGLRIFQSEFSIPSALAAISDLKNIIRSNDDHAIRLSKHLLKTIASLQLMKPGAEPFQQLASRN